MGRNNDCCIKYLLYISKEVQEMWIPRCVASKGRNASRYRVGRKPRPTCIEIHDGLLITARVLALLHSTIKVKG
jgi:hypothetical protein